MMSLLSCLPECSSLAGVKAAQLTLDSRKVSAGTVFVALKGSDVDGHDFIESAIKQGAVAVLCERPVSVQSPVPICVVDSLKVRLGHISHQFYGAKTQDMRVIGVTGTNGKTSTCQYLAQAFSFLGQPCGLIGTNGQGLWGDLRESQNTTPDVISVQQELARQHSEGARVCAMEVSSHGLDQGRVNGVQFSTAVFTNLTRDHLDYHGTMDAYGRAKWSLMQWQNLTNAVVNADDAWVQANRDSIAVKNTLSYGHDKTADIRVVDYRTHTAGLDARITTPYGEAELNLSLLGQFNLSNALAALSVLLVEGIPLKTAARVISNVRPVSGRMEVHRLEKGLTAVVDYAHTPDALKNALQACREHVSGGLGVVFGCGGNRDAGKRAQMAKIAETYADWSVVTDDNPRFENPADIRAEILSGFTNEQRVTNWADREAAIGYAFDKAEKNDVVLIAGKGHERYQEINGVRHLYCDQDAIKRWQERAHVE